MKTELTGGGVLALAVIGGGLALFFFKRKDIAAAAGKVVDSVNPASPDNIVNRGVTAAGAAVTGDQSWTLGGWLADLFSPQVAAANKMNASKPSTAPGTNYQADYERELRSLIGRYGVAPTDVVLNGGAQWTGGATTEQDQAGMLYAMGFGG